MATRKKGRPGESSARQTTTSGVRKTAGKRRGSLARKEMARQREYPASPLPAQHQRSPGLESKVHPRPKYTAPLYRAAAKLQGKVALITGGDSGIGRATALLYAREGADVAIVYLRQEERDAQETRAAIEAEGQRALLLPGNVTSAPFCRRAVARTVKELGGLDILVNNAAYQKDRNTAAEISDEQWDKTFKVNIYGYFYMVKAALRHLGPGSCIINTGSITGLEGSKTLLDYSATKGAIHAFTKSLAQMLVDRKIRVNCVAPGPVWTPLNPVSKPAREIPEFGGDTPYGRPGQPEEIAPAYVFFASNADSSYITGEVLTLLGGETTAA